MKTADFDYYLPPECIAQTPVEPRHAARLLVLDRTTDEIHHSTFWEIGEYLKPGDLLLLNRTRVIPARLFARKQTGGKVEILLLHANKDTTWEVLVGGKKIHTGQRLQLEGGPGACVSARLDGARCLVQFDEPIDAYIERSGAMPLPPYIHTPLQDPERYQTVYSRIPGSAAAPTAGLHFTFELLQRLQQLGIQVAELTLHVGLDTFAPVNEENAENHAIHSEWCELSAETAQLINLTRQSEGRIIAVGTTSVRTVESASHAAILPQVVAAFTGATQLFILPGYRFHAVDGMVTNFHLPRSTLLMLVSAFAGRERILATYQKAVESGYRFYSFGDAMLIL